jgi:hypothetical protein
VVVVEVSTAETGGGDLEEDLVALESGLLGSGLDDLAGLGALVDGERRHLCVVLCRYSGYQRDGRKSLRLRRRRSDDGVLFVVELNGESRGKGNGLRRAI